MTETNQPDETDAAEDTPSTGSERSEEDDKQPPVPPWSTTRLRWLAATGIRVLCFVGLVAVGLSFWRGTGASALRFAWDLRNLWP